MLESAMIMLKNNLKLSFFLCELFLLYFASPDWFVPHLVVALYFQSTGRDAPNTGNPAGF
jgi:hypothetical protein